ncbi:MAG: PLP-dependent aspartate aminotransferase family protein [Calditrichia bacterium]
MKKTPKWDLQSRLVHSGAGKSYRNVRTASPPIFQTSNYLYEDVESGTDILVGKQPGYIYSRYSNPTVESLNEALAGLEGADGCLSFSSGLAAISAAVLAYCRSGDHLVASELIYGGTYHLFQEHMARLGIETTFVNPADIDAVVDSIRPNTRVLYAEPLANPLLVSADIFQWAVQAHRHNCKLLVDNTFTPPPLFSPLDAGADVVIHSATKYLGGHSDLVGGAVCGSTEEIERIRPQLKYHGGIMAPFTAWLLLRGMRTLGLRLKQQCRSAAEIAAFLEKHPAVNKVFYAGLASNPQYEFNKRHFNGFSGMLAFEVKGGFAAAKRVMDNLELVQFTVSLGDVASLISHPASTSHIYLSPEERAAIGVTGGLLRLSVGIEATGDLLADLDQALAAV